MARVAELVAAVDAKGWLQVARKMEIICRVMRVRSVSVVGLSALVWSCSPDSDQTALHRNQTNSLLVSLCDSIVTDSTSLFHVRTEGQPESAWFGRVVGGALFADGGFVVADAGRHLLLLFDASGDLTETLGGQGDGPEEFPGLLDDVYVLGDTIFAFDGSRARWSLFEREATFLRTVSFERESGRGSVGVFPDRSVVTSSGSGFGMDRVSRDTVRLRRLSLRTGEELNSLGSYPGSQRYATLSGGLSVFPLPFGRTATFAAWADQGLVAVGTADSSAVVLLHIDGRPAGTIRLPLSSREVTSAMISDWRAEHPDAAEAMREVELPARTPPYSSIVADAAGFLWVQKPVLLRAIHDEYLVVGGDGSVVEEVLLPADSRVLDVNGEAALVRTVDDLGVQSVAVYPRRCFD